MRSIFFFTVVLIISAATFAQEFDPSQLPPDVQRQYESYLQDRQKPMVSLEVPAYETPPIYAGTDTLRFKHEEIRQEKAAAEVEKIAFFEPVIIDGDTVQNIKKAMPRELKLYGADFFRGRRLLISEVPVSGDYILGSGDNIVLGVWGNVDYEYNLMIDREGKVFIPKAGTIVLAGKTLERAEQALRSLLSKIYSEFDIDLTLAKTRGNTVFVVGEARNPGSYSLPGLARVIDALVVAGGPNEFGSLRGIGVFRNGKKVADLDLYEFLLEGVAGDNIQLSNGDVVVIPRRGPTVAMRGRVRRPALYELKGKTTIGEVIELAGGVLSDAHVEAVMIDRVEDGKHEIVTANLNDSLDNKRFVCSEDDFSVFPVEGYRYNLVFLQGQVVQPGSYGLSDSMLISDLLMNGEQLLPDAYTIRADLVRVLPDRSKEIISICLDSILERPGSKDDLPLQSEDLLVVYSIWDIGDKEFVSIYGAVRRPGEFELFRNMKISDLVFEAGGFTPSAYINESELARVKPGEPTEVITISLKEAVENPASSKDLQLWPYDILFIRDVPGWKLQDVVTITGEVLFPGKYALEKSNERLSDIIKRTGGFTPEAFLKGAVFIRPALAQAVKDRNLEKIVQQTQEAVLDSAGNVAISPFLFTYIPENLARIIIDLDRVIIGRPEDDIVLETGDSIYIPKTPTGVNVVGMVASSGTIHWLPGKRTNYYIDRAGGLTRNADEGGIRIVKANGKVIKASRRTAGIEPGDAIIVPQRIKKKADWMDIISETVSIIGGMATTLYIILKL